jgi:hypothetical protein
MPKASKIMQCAGLLKLLAEVLIRVATLRESACYNSHKANYDSLYRGKASASDKIPL